MAYLKIASYFAALALGFALAYAGQNLRYGITIAETEKATAEAIAANAQAAAKQYQDLQIQTEQDRASYIKKIEAGENENKTLRSDIERGAKRLRINAKCPTMPGAVAGAGGNDNATAELDADARQAYFDLRTGITKTESLLAFCQSELISRSSKKTL